jgi:hypothetical protein
MNQRHKEAGNKMQCKVMKRKELFMDRIERREGNVRVAWVFVVVLYNGTESKLFHLLV